MVAKQKSELTEEKTHYIRTGRQFQHKEFYFENMGMIY